MNNPFFVLCADSDNEVIGIIRNEVTKKISIQDRISNAIKSHYDYPIFSLDVPDDVQERHKPATISAVLERPISEGGNLEIVLTLEMAWEY